MNARGQEEKMGTAKNNISRTTSRQQKAKAFKREALKVLPHFKPVRETNICNIISSLYIYAPKRLKHNKNKSTLSKPALTLT